MKKRYPINARGMAQRLRRRREVAAIAAVVLSLGLHAFLGFMIRQGWIGISRDAPPVAAEPRHLPLDVEIRPRDWMRTVEAMEALRFGAREIETDLATAPPETREIDPAFFEPGKSPPQWLDDEMRIDPDELAPSPIVDIGPGQEILTITERVAAEPPGALRRLLAPPLERVERARDIVVPVAADEIRAHPAAGMPSADAAREDWPEFTPETWTPPLTEASADEKRAAEAAAESIRRPLSEELGERPETIAGVEPVDRFLRARVRQYTSPREPDYGYVRIEIARRAEDFLEVLPKDIFFVMDLSGSMGVSRVEACRRGIRDALGRLSEHDRFNIVTFAHAPGQFADDWLPAVPENLRRAQPFLDAMVSGGRTDIDAALNRILEMERDPLRPTLAIMLTDGIPTAGVTNSTLIIENFTVRNRGAISVFAMAAAENTIANMYLLDMLTYRNRGNARGILGDTAESADLTVQIAREIARPVLTDLRYRFTRDSRCEAYPVVLPLLYLDSPLVLYGRFPRDRRELVFQVIGEARGRRYDFVFHLPLERVERGEADIRDQWARHRIYHLIGEHMRSGEDAVIEALFETSRKFGVEIPYLDEFSPPGRLRWWRR